jgi:DNA-directed RNA polymerase subunit delta
MRPVDVAYEVLKEHGQPLLVHELMDRVLEALQQDPDPRRMAQIYTDMNLDVRFVYRGGGLWGLRDWTPKPATRGGGGSSSREKIVVEDEADELEEEDGWE